MTRIYHHIGLPTDEKQPNEKYIADTKVWVTDPADHRLRVEFLRFEDDSPVKGPLREMAHVAYRVDDMDAAIEGKEIMIEPFSPLPGLTVAFIKEDEAVIEFMKFKDGATEFAHLDE